jgi:hypothetical protein
MRHFENEKKISKKKRFKGTLALRKKGKYFNYGKKKYFAREYRFSKTNNAKSDNVKEERDRKT